MDCFEFDEDDTQKVWQKDIDELRLKQKVILGVANNFGACMKGPGHAEHKSMNKVSFGW